MDVDTAKVPVLVIILSIIAWEGTCQNTYFSYIAVIAQNISLVPSPTMTSPGPRSIIESASVTPIHPIAGGTPNELQLGRINHVKP